MKNWFDENMLLHHKPNPTEDTSENELLFTAEYILLCDKVYMYRKPVNEFRVDNMLTFYANEKNLNKRISHDNKTGMVAVYPDLDESIFNLGNRFNYHPRDIVFYGIRKYGGVFNLFRWVISIHCILTCFKRFDYRPIKKNNWLKIALNLPLVGKYFRKKYSHRVIEATSGKMLAWVRMNAANMKWTLNIATKLLYKHTSWHRVATVYFREPGHPVPLLMRTWEDQHEQTFK